jgi:pyruvate formate lyase activating enzyme
MRPAVLKKICGSKDTAPDFIAMDIKLPPERYAELTMQKADSPEQAAETAEKIRESIAFIRESGIEHEFRALTLPAPYFSEKDMSDIKALADDTLKIRAFRGGNCLDETWNQYPSSS